MKLNMTLIQQRLDSIASAIKEETKQIEENIVSVLSERGIKVLPTKFFDQHFWAFDYDVVDGYHVDLELGAVELRGDGSLVLCFDDDEGCERNRRGLEFLAKEPYRLKELCTSIDATLDQIDKGPFSTNEEGHLVCTLKVGDKVKWDDPAITDFEPEERQSQLDRVWTVVSIGGDTSEDAEVESSDDVIVLSDEYGDTETTLEEILKI